MEASAAGVNAPHVNDTADPEDFFGDDDETTHADEATEEVTAQPATAEEAAAQPAAETANEGDHIAAGAPVEPETPAGVESLAPEPPAQTVPATATAAGRAAAAEAQAAPPAEEPTPPAADAAPPQEEPTPAPEAEPTKASKDRPYVVLRELALTEETLTKLLEHVRGGADPIDVYLHVETVDARNDQHALKQVYVTHRERIGDRPRLVPVSKRAWRVRQVQPRQRVEEALEIT
jgi:cell division septation protein DedD